MSYVFDDHILTKGFLFLQVGQMVKVQKATDSSSLTMIAMEVIVANNHQHLFDHSKKHIVFAGDLLTLMSCQA